MTINRSERTKIGERLQRTTIEFTPFAADSSREAFRPRPVARESTTQNCVELDGAVWIDESDRQ
jgi:hypothetical protein